MSEALEALADTWQERGTKEPGWFKGNYEAAADQIVRELNYWSAPDDGSSTTGDGRMVTWCGSISTPGAVRTIAFELLVLAALAEQEAKS